MELNDLLTAAVDSRASDVLLAAGAPPMFRIDGELQPANLPALATRTLETFCLSLLDPRQLERLQQQQDVDLSIAVPRLGRFRFNVHVQRQSYAAAIRHIPAEVPSLEDLDLPPVVESLTRLKHGLVLVTGQTGSGKTTTLAAMVDRINRLEAKHIVTLEDPIEYQHTHIRSLVEQREIGVDCPDFASGLRHVLRQDPDVILVGELRDLATIRTAIQAAETGHLVLGTLHSSTSAGSIDRIVEVFPAEEQGQIRSHLAECLRAVLTQRLAACGDRRGRIVLAEVLVATRAVQTSIREGTAHLIPGIISTGRRFGMQTMEQAIKERILNGQIRAEEADDHLQELTAAVCS